MASTNITRTAKRATTPRAIKPKAAPAPKPTLKFHQRLVLHDWMLHLLGVKSFDALAAWLKDPDLEGLTPDNRTLYAQEIAVRFRDRQVSGDALRQYDENIVRHWHGIARDRREGGSGARLKYFQYLALLFTEIYLDRFFSDRQTLLNDINTHVETFNARLGAGDHVDGFSEVDLRKLAFWSATGSGKTLLMHCHIKQYLHYAEKSGTLDALDHIFLLTPSEELSAQHLRELAQSGIDARPFSKEGRDLFSGRSVEVIEIQKLRDEPGEKSVAIESLTGNNLVLVDEGHRGASGEEWKSRRERLARSGFAFEYSATFGQAVGNTNTPLLQEYARSVLFDYSYKYFYADGNGKDYRILNLSGEQNDETRLLYLTACLLAFYQQLKYWEDKGASLERFHFERPLWIFVGSSVTKDTSAKDLTDIQQILVFLAEFVNDAQGSVARIKSLLERRANLLAGGHDPFERAFDYLAKSSPDAQSVFADIQRALFRAPGGGRLRVENLKSAEGEIGLRLGDNPYFGVVNVGDANKLCIKCRERPELEVSDDREFSASLFESIQERDSTVNVLIGARKFAEGWSSWRVSTMGLMNVGQGEGPQIIQLFGRGVRLKGYNWSLKRSAFAPGIVPPADVHLLETLNVFGLRADYMAAFQEHLKREDVPSNEALTTFVLPTLETPPATPLKTLNLPPGGDFEKYGPPPTLDVPPKWMDSVVKLDLYPKLESLSGDGVGVGVGVEKQPVKLGPLQLAFVDFDAVYAELERYKGERDWHTLRLSRAVLRRLFEPAYHDWYELSAPPQLLNWGNFDASVRGWQETVVALLKKYCEAFYKGSKSNFERPLLKIDVLDLATDKSHVPAHTLTVDASDAVLMAHLQDLKESLERGELKDLSFEALDALCFDRHLYQPLLCLAKGSRIKVSPVALDTNEKRFVCDLRSYWKSGPDFLKDTEIYLLRNKSKGGIGFFDESNFYPDFVLWLVRDSKQFISFVDPKGLVHLRGIDDPKVRLYQRIRQLQHELGDTDVVLNSFLISNTPYIEIPWRGSLSKTEFNQQHIFFQDDPTHIEKLLRAASTTEITS